MLAPSLELREDRERDRSGGQKRDPNDRVRSVRAGRAQDREQNERDPDREG